MGYRVGTLLRINGMDARVIGSIQYVNPQDGSKDWTEYRLKTDRGECWLSCDDFYKEYSISWPANDVRGNIGPEWHEVDRGTQVVRSYSGDVDVDPGEKAIFIEYEDESEEHTLSVEMWSDGTEYSRGEYIEKSDILETGYKQPSGNFRSFGIILAILFFFFPLLGSLLQPLFSSVGKKDMSNYIANSAAYVYETSITGNEQQKASVYRYYMEMISTDDVAKDIINGIEGKTESVTQKDDMQDAEIAIMTKYEYCLVYHPEDNANEVLVQVSDRKYNYSSDQEPYRCSSADSHWYRIHYFSAGYGGDRKTFRKTQSAYSMYEGDTIHNIGNGYFDSYSNSIRQSSVNNRNADGGGLSSGK